MSRRRHTPEQIVRKLREADRLVGEGMELPEVWKQLGGVGGDLSPVAQPVRWDEGRRREAVEGAGGRESEAEADRGRSGARRSQALKEVDEGKLVSPSRRRRAVLMLQDRLGVSQRRACRYVGQTRSTQRREPLIAQDDAALRAELKAFSRRRPRWGYRQAHQHLLEQGRLVNRKRTQRLWREEGLRVPAKRRKRQRRGEPKVPGDRLRAERPDHVWALHFSSTSPTMAARPSCTTSWTSSPAKRSRWRPSGASTPTTSSTSCTASSASVATTRSGAL